MYFSNEVNLHNKSCQQRTQSESSTIEESMSVQCQMEKSPSNSDLPPIMQEGPKGFEPLTWWSEATRTIQAMQRVQTIKNLTGLNICLNYESIKKSFKR